MKIIKPIFQLFLIYTLCLPLFSFASEEDYYVGEIVASDILSNFTNFAKHQDDIDYTKMDLTSLKNAIGDIQVKVFFGQWCHDSVREVPRLISLFSAVNNPNINTWFYALDTNKSDPLTLSKSHGIKKTPTIIVYQNGMELGRILEFPQIDWATDIGQLLVNSK